MLTKMIDFMEYYYHELSLLLQNIVESKRNIRNLLVFFNSMVIRLANATVNIEVEPRDENNVPTPRPSPADIENSKS